MGRSDRPSGEIRIGHARDSTSDWLNLEIAPCGQHFHQFVQLGSPPEAQVWDSVTKQLAVISIA